MIEFYKTGPEGTKQVEAPEPGCWVSITCPTPEDRAWLHAKAGIVPEFVRSALDDDESSHLDFDDDTNQTLVIVDCAALEDASDLEDPSITQYDTQPLSVLLLPESNMIVTVSLTPNTTIDAFSSGRVRGLDTRRTTRFLLQLLLNIAQTYQSYLRNINKQFTRTEKLLRKTMRNEELIKMLGLERSLIYFSTSLKALQAVLIKLDNGKIIKFTGNDRDDIDDIKIEVSQATEMCDIATKLLNGSMDAFGSVISNNMNITMRRLTTITLTLSVPTMVFSFYGMNVGMLPFAESFLFPILLSVTCCIIVAVLFTQSKLFK